MFRGELAMRSLKLPKRHARLLALALLLAVGPSVAANAQSYPDHPIRLVAPFPAGGLADVLARAVGDQISKTLGSQLSLRTAPAPAAMSAPTTSPNRADGYSLLMTSAGF